MATKITLTVDEELTAQECKQLQTLMCDAFGEFASRRFPAEQYVDERYPVTNEGYSWLNRPEKIKEVQSRIVLAKKLHHAVFDYVVDPEPDAAKRAYDTQRFLQETFGMSGEEARATYNQLEDKRISKLMAEQGLVKS
jgi:hypothetical protein